MATESHSAGDHAHAGHDHDDGAVHVHLSSTRFYVGIFLALVALTILTVKVSYYDFGSANIIIAMAVATTKASLVAVFFMHLAHDKKFNALTFIAAFVFLGIFIVFAGVWVHHAIRLRQMRLADALDAAAPEDPADASPEEASGPV